MSASSKKFGEKGLDLILADILRERILSVFTSNLDSSDLSDEDKRENYLELCQWIKTNNASHIVDASDLDEFVLKEISEEVATRGATLDQPKEKITDALNHLSFPRHPDWHTLALLHDLLVATAHNNQPERNAAVRYVQTWLENQADLSIQEHIKFIENFHHNDQKYQVEFRKARSPSPPTLLNYRPIEVTKPRRAESPLESKIVLAQYENYFNQIVRPPKSAHFKKKVSEVASNFFDAIDDGDKSTIESAYLRLINPTFVEEVKLTDTDLKALESNLTDYEINRIFLHATFVAPAAWSDNFTKQFESTLKLVKQTPQNFGVADVYVAQLDYLAAFKQNPKTKLKPAETRIILPERAETISDCLNIYSTFDVLKTVATQQLKPDAHTAYIDYIRLALYSQKEKSCDLLALENLLTSLPTRNRETLLESLQELNLLKPIIDKTEMKEINNDVLLCFPEKERESLRLKYFEEIMPKIVITAKSLKQIWKNIIASYQTSFMRDPSRSQDKLQTSDETTALENATKAKSNVERYEILMEYLNKPEHKDDELAKTLIGFGLEPIYPSNKLTEK